MIQIYKADNTDFDKNGDMTLLPSEATVHVILISSIPLMRKGAGNTLQKRQ